MSISENTGMYMPVAPCGTGGFGGGFGNGDGWWIILLFILLGGWGGRGYGSGSGADQNYVLTSDFAQIERKLDGIANGICDSSYANAQLINGVTASLAQQGFETRTAVGNVQTQMSECCCDVKGLVKDVNYNMAQNHNATQQTIYASSRDIIDSQTAGTRAILDELRAQAIEAKNTRIAELERQLTMANLSASQGQQTATLVADNCAQTQALIQRLAPTPVPSYTVPNPNCCYNGCGC